MDLRKGWREAARPCFHSHLGYVLDNVSEQLDWQVNTICLLFPWPETAARLIPVPLGHRSGVSVRAHRFQSR